MRQRDGSIALILVGAALTVSGCAATVDKQPISEAEIIRDTCTFLAGGAYDDATEFFLSYTAKPTSADADELKFIIDRFTSASETSEGDLQIALRDVLDEFNAIDDRINGGDPLTPVDYQSLNDGLASIGAECLDS